MSYALRADGTVVAWGRNDEGQLGDGTTVRRTTPVRVGTLTGIVGIAGGRDHGLALRSDGTVWAWGSNDYGQIGDGSLTDRTTPVQVASDITQVIAGAHHSYALRTDRTVAAWGRNYRANLGDGTTTTRTRAVTVRNLSSVVSIGSGRDTGMAVLESGNVMGWGANDAGQVGRRHDHQPVHPGPRPRDRARHARRWRRAGVLPSSSWLPTDLRPRAIRSPHSPRRARACPAPSTPRGPRTPTAAPWSPTTGTSATGPPRQPQDPPRRTRTTLPAPSTSR